MLDVHPPHESAHSWRDFFIHIATIVVGLLIAIGLEQMVEWFHHKHEIKETRAALHEELLNNIDRFHQNVSNVRHEEARLENNLRVLRFLQKHPGTPLEELPGVIVWGLNTDGSSQAAWNTAKQSDVFTLMPHEEVETFQAMYAALERSDERTWAVWDALNKASAPYYLEPDIRKWSVDQIDAELPLLQECMRLNFLEINALNNVSKSFPEFGPAPPDDEPYSFKPKRDWLSQDEMKKARAFNQPLLQQAVKLDKEDEPGRFFASQMAERGAIHVTEILADVRKRYPSFTPDEDSLNAWGYILITRDNSLKAAIAVLTLNAQLYPNSWNVYDSLGEVYARSGQKQRAIEYYEHALKLKPDSLSSADALHALQH